MRMLEKPAVLPQYTCSVTVCVGAVQTQSGTNCCCSLSGQYDSLSLRPPLPKRLCCRCLPWSGGVCSDCGHSLSCGAAAFHAGCCTQDAAGRAVYKPGQQFQEQPSPTAFCITTEGPAARQSSKQPCPRNQSQLSIVPCALCSCIVTCQGRQPAEAAAAPIPGCRVCNIPSGCAQAHVSLEHPWHQ